MPPEVAHRWDTPVYFGTLYLPFFHVYITVHAYLCMHSYEVGIQIFRVSRGNGTDIDYSRAHTEEEVKMWAKMEEAQVSEL